MQSSVWHYTVGPELGSRLDPGIAAVAERLSEAGVRLVRQSHVPDERGDTVDLLSVSLDSDRVTQAAAAAGMEDHRPVGEGFLIERSGHSVVITGGSSRGCLYGLFEFEDRLLCGTLDDESGPLLRVPWFHDRSGGILRFAQLPPPDFSDVRYAEFLCRHAVNFNGLHIGTTNIGPDASRSFAVDCYGGGSSNFFFHSWMSSEQLERLVSEFEEEAPGSVTYTNPRTHSGTVTPILSVFTRFGRDRHRKALAEQLDAHPGINTLLYTFGDWGAIHGDGCPHVGSLPIHRRVIAWLEAIRDLAAELRPGIRVIARTWYYSAEFIRDMIAEAPAGIGIRQKEPASIVLDQPLGWELMEDNYSDVMLTTDRLSEQYGPIYLSGGRLRGTDFYPALAVGDTDESIDPVIGIATPRMAAGKLRRLAENGILNFSVWWGGLNPDAYSPNHAVIREATFDPWTDVEALLTRVARRDFGQWAQPMQEFWTRVEAAVTG